MLARENILTRRANHRHYCGIERVASHPGGGFGTPD
jgi:hypothetical protein